MDDIRSLLYELVDQWTDLVRVVGSMCALVFSPWNQAVTEKNSDFHQMQTEPLLAFGT
jgi:hypothetical protein